MVGLVAVRRVVVVLGWVVIVTLGSGDVSRWWYGMTNSVGTNVELIYLVICARTP